MAEISVTGGDEVAEEDLPCRERVGVFPHSLCGVDGNSGDKFWPKGKVDM
jgi:hypothetical protein